MMWRGVVSSPHPYFLTDSPGPGSTLKAEAVLPSQGFCREVLNKHFAKLFHREGDKWSTFIPHRSLASKASSSWVSMAMHVWGVEKHEARIHISSILVNICEPQGTSAISQ